MLWTPGEDEKIICFGDGGILGDDTLVSNKRRNRYLCLVWLCWVCVGGERCGGCEGECVVVKEAVWW